MTRMRTAVFLFVLSPLLALSQTLVERTFLIRAETTTMDPYSGMTHVCILVHSDGKYRLERSFQGVQGGAPETRVYLDQLPESSLKQMQALLADQNFQQITTSELQGGIIQNMDVLMVSIPREHNIQNLNFETVNQRKPYEKTLKPLLNWMKDLQKRKVPVAKAERSDNCKSPQIIYRSAFKVESDSTETPEPGQSPQR